MLTRSYRHMKCWLSDCTVGATTCTLRVGKRNMSSTTKRLLFVCVENSNRSQMAEAFARIHGGDFVEAYSAGSRPSGKINSKAVTAMGELGYDLDRHKSKSLLDLPDIEYDFVATMGCGDECPYIRGREREDWAIPDPKNMESENFRAVRDEIESKVKAVIARLRAN